MHEGAVEERSDGLASPQRTSKFGLGTKPDPGRPHATGPVPELNRFKFQVGIPVTVWSENVTHHVSE
jgi:hypothetical protein